VTVGGAALAGINEAHKPKANAAATAQLAQNRFMSFLPGADAADVRMAADAKFAADDRDFKARQRDQRFRDGFAPASA
jgi:hypothetical protein